MINEFEVKGGRGELPGDCGLSPELYTMEVESWGVVAMIDSQSLSSAAFVREAQKDLTECVVWLTKYLNMEQLCEGLREARRNRDVWREDLYQAAIETRWVFQAEEE